MADFFRSEFINGKVVDTTHGLPKEAEPRAADPYVPETKHAQTIWGDELTKSSDDPLDHAYGPGGATVYRGTLDESTSIIKSSLLGGDTRLMDLVSWGWVRKYERGYDWTPVGKTSLEKLKAGKNPFADAPSGQQDEDGGADQRDDQKQPGEKLSTYTETLIAETVERAGIGTVGGVIETMITGGDPEPFIRDVATAMHIEPHEARGKIAEIHEEFRQQTRRALGFDAETFEQFSEWAQSPEQGRAAHEAMWRQVEFGDLRPMKQLAARFRSSGVQWDEESVLNAEFGSGITARRSDDGKTVLLDIPNHGSMAFRQAVQLGLVRVMKK
jgi:hypothetical protein